MARVIESRLVVVLMLVWLALFSAGLLWPASWWLDVRSVTVSDGKWPPVMVVDRDIRRDFYGSYNVAVYRYENGGWVAVCTARRERLYRAGAHLPAALTLEWWTDGGDCSASKLNVPGRYNMTTTWVINMPYLPDREVSVRSNIWSVP